jgi:hypothetical protein
MEDVETEHAPSLLSKKSTNENQNENQNENKNP